MIRIQHNLSESPSRNIAMLLPIGDFLNTRLLEAKIGDSIRFMDDKESKIVYMEVIKKNSKEAEGLALAIYGLPLNAVFNTMVRNWKSEVKKDLLIFLVVENETKN